MTMFHGPRSPYQGKLSQLEATVAELQHKNAELRRENEHLRSETKRLGGGNNGPGVQTRRCLNCKRNLPDGPQFFPGYEEPPGANSAAEAKRYECVYCRLAPLTPS